MSDLSTTFRTLAKAAATLSLLALSAVLVVALWQAYVLAPWTRDGRVNAQVVRVAPDVSGTVIEVAVGDDRLVRRGELLYRIDPARFHLAVAQAEARLAAAGALLRQKSDDARRRRGLGELISAEEVQRANQALAVAQAEQRQAQVELDMARLDLRRTEVQAPVDGYVTHLRLRPGDYALAGQAGVTLLEARSFWVTGYFEETKLRGIAPGAEAQIRLMGFDEPLRGHVASIGRGITDANRQADSEGLPSVEPSFSWIRLAQRIPVRVEIDHLPESVLLAAGMTCSVAVRQPGRDVPQGRLLALLQRWM